MIYDTLENMGQYAPLGSRMADALHWLAETDFSRLPDGRVELDGGDVYASISSYETRSVNNMPEAHRKFLDIQYLIMGTELVGVAPLSTMEAEKEARPDGDIWFYNGATEPLTLGGDRVLVLWPQDAHAPCIAVGEPEQVRKCVIKVRL